MAKRNNAVWRQCDYKSPDYFGTFTELELLPLACETGRVWGEQIYHDILTHPV